MEQQAVVRVLKRKKPEQSTSKVLLHPKSRDIIRDLVDGVKSQHQIASEYSTEEHPLTQAGISRFWRGHLINHLPARKDRMKEAHQKLVTTRDEQRKILEEAGFAKLMRIIEESDEVLEQAKAQGNIAAVEAILVGSMSKSLEWIERALSAKRGEEPQNNGTVNIYNIGRDIALPHVGPSIDYEDTEAQVVDSDDKEEIVDYLEGKVHGSGNRLQ